VKHQAQESGKNENCKTTLWIKKSGFGIKEMSFTTFGPFRAARARFEPEIEGE